MKVIISMKGIRGVKTDSAHFLQRDHVNPISTAAALSASLSRNTLSHPPLVLYLAYTTLSSLKLCLAFPYLPSLLLSQDIYFEMVKQKKLSNMQKEN